MYAIRSYYEACGAIVARLEGLSLKRVPHAALHSSPAGKSDWLYEVAWHPRDLPIADSAEQGIASPNALADHVSKHWRALSESHGLGMQLEANRALDALCISSYNFV